MTNRPVIDIGQLSKRVMPKSSVGKLDKNVMHVTYADGRGVRKSSPESMLQLAQASRQ